MEPNYKTKLKNSLQNNNTENYKENYGKQIVKSTVPSVRLYGRIRPKSEMSVRYTGGSKFPIFNHHHFFGLNGANISLNSAPYGDPLSSS